MAYRRYGDVYCRPVSGGQMIVDAPVTPLMVPALQDQSVRVGGAGFLFKGGQYFRKTTAGCQLVPVPWKK